MEKIIPLVTTPLALAALSILVLGVILQRTGVRRDVVTKVFWLIMVLAIMGNVGFLLTRFVASDTIIRGSVRDSSGAPISQVIVDIDDVGEPQAETTVYLKFLLLFHAKGINIT